MGCCFNLVNICVLMIVGIFCFVIGLVGFIFFGNSLLLWGMLVVVFIVGEIIYVLGEYMLIDYIVLLGMKVSYFFV